MGQSKIKVEKLNPARTFLGYKCLYEIHNENRIICHVLNEDGDKTGDKKSFNNSLEIEDKNDYWRVSHLLRTKNISNLMDINACPLISIKI